MPERLDKLKVMISDLEDELESLDSMDVETRQMLEDAIQEIQAALKKRDPTQLEPDTLAARLRQTAEQFESSHPNLFGIVSRMVDALGQMGI